MTRSADDLGAPDTEPGGNVADQMSAQPTPGRSLPETVLTRCVRPGCSCGWHKASTLTVPGRPGAAVAVTEAMELFGLVGDEQSTGAGVVPGLYHRHLHPPGLGLLDTGGVFVRVSVLSGLDPHDGTRTGIDQTGVSVAPSDCVRRAAVCPLYLQHLAVADGVVNPCACKDDAVPDLCFHDVLRCWWRVFG